MKLSMEKAMEMMRMNGGNLDLTSSTHITELPDHLVVPGDLSISESTILELPKDLTVRRRLNANYTLITTLPDDLIVGDTVWLMDSKVSAISNKAVFGGSLILTGSPIHKLPDDLVIPGTLAISDTNVKELGKNTIIGGALRLNRSTRIPNDTKIGLWIDYVDGSSGYHHLNDPDHQLIGIRYASGRYLYADHILTPIKRTKQCGEYTVYVGRIPWELVVSDGEYFAHCGDVKEGIEDVTFKKLGRSCKEEYASLSLSDSLPADEMVKMYRIITGACREGTRKFLVQLGPLKSSYTVKEAIDLTRGQYGARQFELFFAA